MILSNARQPNESFAAYKKRRRAVNRTLRLKLRGTLAFVSTEPRVIPPIGIDAAADRAVLAGKLRDCVLVTRPDGEQVRVCRTKGVTYRREGPRAWEARRIAAGRVA